MRSAAVRLSDAALALMDVCADLELQVRVTDVEDGLLTIIGPQDERIVVDTDPRQPTMIEQTLRGLRFDFSRLPLLVDGDSKEIRLLTPRIALAKLKPTVYSFTYNRYGTVPGSDELRARFSAAVFRLMADSPGPRHLSSAFLGLVESDVGPLLAERRVDPGNLEVRVKRYHIGSPVHRYRFTEDHPTVVGPPLVRWARFATPVVCFDWRHPLTDPLGVRLADEPLSDDYASVWIADTTRAKRLARDTFEWLEQRFARSGLKLIDICFFIDRSGTVIFGEISPDCMRVRGSASDDAEALEKDVWRSGGEPDELLDRYQRLHQMVFGAPQ